MAGPWERFSQPANLQVPGPWQRFAADVVQEPTREQLMRRQAEEQLAREREENPGLDALSAPGAAETAVRGIPILGGFVDEARAGLSAGANVLTGGAVGQPYDEALAYERARHARSDAEHPVANTVTKLAGGVATAPLTPVLNATTTLGRIGAGGVTGAAYGAGHGFAEGEGGFEQRLETAGDYAKFGGALGVAVPTVASATSGAFNAARAAAPQIAARLPGRNADAIANDIIRQRIERSGTTPQAVHAELQAGQEAARFGPNSQAVLPEMIADTSDTMQRLTGSVYRQGGEAGETVRRALETRQRGDPNQISRFASGDTGQRGQIDDALSRALRISSSKSARATERQITAEQAREGNRLYDIAYQNSDEFDLGPAIVGLGLTRQQYTGPFRAALDRASALFEAPMGAMTRGNRNFYGMDIRRFDAAKKQLDDMIESAQRTGEGNLARELTNFKNNLLKQVHGVDEAGNATRNLAYRDARNAWGSAAENREAIEMGRAALREGSEVSVEQFRSLTPGQQIFFRQGFLESARNALGRRRPGNDATLPFQEARVQDLLREIIPNTQRRTGTFADRAGNFGEYLSRQERMGQTRNRVLGNSATAQRHQDDAEFAADALSRVMMGLRGGTNAILEVVGAALTRATSYRQDVAAALARRLVEADPAAQARILQNLQRAIGPNRFQEFTRSLDAAVPALPGAVGDAEGTMESAPRSSDDRFNPPMRLGGPESIPLLHGAMYSQDDQNRSLIADVRRSSPEVKKEVSASLVSEMGRTQEDPFSPAAFAASWNQATPYAKRAIFGSNQRHYAALNRLARIGQSLDASGGPAVSQDLVGGDAVEQPVQSMVRLPAVLSEVDPRLGQAFLSSPHCVEWLGTILKGSALLKRDAGSAFAGVALMSYRGRQLVDRLKSDPSLDPDAAKAIGKVVMQAVDGIDDARRRRLLRLPAAR